MRKILTIIPFVVGEDLLAARAKTLQRDATNRGTCVSIVSLEKGPTIADFSSQPNFRHAISEIVELTERYQNDFDGIMISCFEDPGLVEARKIATIPVVGPCETALLMARMAGGRFFIVSPDPGSEALYRETAAGLGLSENFASFVHVDFEVENVVGEGDLVPRVVDAIRDARTSGAADVAILGCTAFTECYDEIRKKVGGRIIEPARSSIKMLELLIDLGLQP